MYNIFRDHKIFPNVFEELPSFGNQLKFKIIKHQRFYVRTNCLDCLDRTNAVQAKLAFLGLIQILDQFEKRKMFEE